MGMMLNVTTEVVANGTERLVDVVGKEMFIVLTLYDYFMLLLGLVGNALILYGAVLYNAIELDKVSLVFVKNVAVADLWWTVVTTLTICVSNTATNTWVLGEEVCLIVAYLRHPLAAAEIILICAVTVHRVLSLRCALKGDPLTTNAARILSTSIWVVSFVSVLGVALYHRAGVDYNPLLSTCVLDLMGTEETKVAAGILTVFLVILPFAATIVCNLGLLAYVLRLQQLGDRAPCTAFVTVFSICGLFTITGLPNMLRILLPIFGQESPVSLEVVNAHAYLINASCNAVIITVTNRRFRCFLLRRLCGARSASTARLPSLVIGNPRASRSQQVTPGVTVVTGSCRSTPRL